MGALVDITGKRFGRLVVLGTTPQRARSGQMLWNCRCDCGHGTKATGIDLRRGSTQSCGCQRKEKATTHGKSETKEFETWCGMHTRCRNPNDVRFKHYGGRGITVCDRWHEFENFLADMGPRPRGTTIDRIDNDGNYEPGNCRWATRKEQSRNKRSNRIVEFQGRAMTLVEAIELSGLSQTTVQNRLHRGMPADLALTLPMSVRQRRATA